MARKSKVLSSATMHKRAKHALRVACKYVGALKHHKKKRRKKGKSSARRGKKGRKSR